MSSAAPHSLTDEQQAVVDTATGTVLVLAAVGSGKTTTLGHRIAAQLAAGCPPHRILAITFTNRAAKHLRKSVDEVAGRQATKGAWISTFHALCCRILREEFEAANLPEHFSVLDEEDTLQILQDLEHELFALCAGIKRYGRCRTQAQADDACLTVNVMWILLDSAKF